MYIEQPNYMQPSNYTEQTIQEQPIQKQKEEVYFKSMLFTHL